MLSKSIFFLTLFLAMSVSAQSVISTQGDSYSNGNVSIDYTIGEIIIATETDGSNDVTQGFHQTNWKFLEVLDYAPEMSIEVYPNPMGSNLNVKMEDFTNVQFTLYNNEGKEVICNNLHEKSTLIKVNELPHGSYTLRFRNESSDLKIFKLIKQ